jgi:hypothetical protein
LLLRCNQVAMPVIKPWHAALLILAEQVARGGKPLASLGVLESNPGEVDLYLREWNKTRPVFARRLEWRIEPWGVSGYMAYIFYDEMVWQIYTEGIRMPDSAAKHALMGFLFGYHTDDILSYVKFNRGKEEST